MSLATTPRPLALVAALGGSALLAGCAGSQDAADPAAGPTATVTATATVTQTVTASPTGSPLPGTEDCGEVAYEADTDAGAFDIEATGVGCRVARTVARGAEAAQGEAYQAGPGFSCEPTGTVGQLPSVVYECTGPADQRVRFEAS